MNKRLCAVLIIMSTNSHGYPPQSHDDSQPDYAGPRRDEIILHKVTETPRVNSEYPLSATIENRSRFYLDRLAIKCVLSDSRGYRVFKRIIFKSDTVLNTVFLGSGRLGIPAGRMVDVGLYTANNQWRPGDYTYDCTVYQVSGSGGG